MTWGASWGDVPRAFMFLLRGLGHGCNRALLHLDARRNISCERERKENVNLGNGGFRNLRKNKLVRHRGLTAHARARYRCFLPDLAGLARVRRVRPMPDLNHSSIPNSPTNPCSVDVALDSHRRREGACIILPCVPLCPIVVSAPRASALLSSTRAHQPACDFRCKNLPVPPSFLVRNVEQYGKIQSYGRPIPKNRRDPAP